MLAVVVRRRCNISLNRCAARMRTPPDLLKSAASTIEDAYSGGRRIGAAAWSRARGWRPWRAAARLGEERGSGAGRDDDGDVATAQRRRRRGRSGVRRRGAPQRWALGLAVAVACPSVAVHDFGRGDVDAAGRGVTTRRGGAARRPGAEKASCGKRQAGRARHGTASCGCTGGVGMVARCKGGRLRCLAGARPRGASHAGEVVRAVAAVRRAAHGERGGGAAGRWRGGRCVVEARRGAGRCAIGGSGARRSVASRRRAARRARPWANEEKDKV